MIRARLHEQEVRQAIGVPGAGELAADGVAPLDAAEDRCVYFANGDAAVATARESLAGRRECIVIAPTGSGLAGELDSCRVLEVDDPRGAITRVLAFVEDHGRQAPWVEAPEISPSASISPHAVIEGDVRIADDVRIEPFCTVGPDVSIGRGSVLRAGARIYGRVSIGEGSMVGENSVIGGAGFGFVRDEAGNRARMPHLAGLVIGSHVEIGPLSVVFAGAITPTTIEDGVKIAALTGISHGARIGNGAALAGGNIIGGSAEIGEQAWIGMSATVRNGRRVGAYSLVGMDASVQQDVPDDAIARGPRPEVSPRPADHDRSGIGFPPARDTR
jgi:UDP-3-O-[3-hydroxymyristoyl] glucosamine N-acyltransferase LpxD